MLLVACALLAPSLANCGGRSERIDSDDDGGHSVGGDAGASTSGGAFPTGGVSTGGSSAGGAPTGGMFVGGGPAGGTSAGGPIDAGPGPALTCRLPVAPGPCRGLNPSYWFDASTGVCMPFNYGGCEGNDNRFDSMEACYDFCGGRGERDDAACVDSYECTAWRVVPQCCSEDVREFVGIRIAVDFTCTEPMFGCTTPCAADCERLPQDGYIGAACVRGHCIPRDVRNYPVTDCTVNDDCEPRFGVDCCRSCDTSKLVALSKNFDIETLICGPDIRCDISDHCPPEDYAYAVCSSGSCMAVPPLLAPPE